MIQKTRPRTYAFIDSQNLNLGIQAADWKLDFQKFRLYLKNKYGVEKAYLFIGQLPGNESLYDSLQDAGGKLLHIMVPNKNYSQLLGRFLPYIIRLDRLKGSLAYKKDQRRRSVETLGVSGHGDVSTVTKKPARVNNSKGKKQ